MIKVVLFLFHISIQLLICNSFLELFCKNGSRVRLEYSASNMKLADLMEKLDEFPFFGLPIFMKLSIHVVLAT